MSDAFDVPLDLIISVDFMLILMLLYRLFYNALLQWNMMDLHKCIAYSNYYLHICCGFSYSEKKKFKFFLKISLIYTEPQKKRCKVYI